MVVAVGVRGSYGAQGIDRQGPVEKRIREAGGKEGAG